MINVSNDFKTAMKQPIKELDGYIKIDDDNEIRSADDLISFKISCDSAMCKTAMRKLEVKCLGEHNLLGEWVHVGFGVRLANGTFDYLDYGSFLITEITTVKDTDITTMVGYDEMILSMTSYNTLNVEYPITLYDYTVKLCEACGLELGNSTFTNADYPINLELWENIDGITYRDILVQIAQSTASTCIISNDDKVYFKYLTDTGENLTYDNMKKLKLEPKYGEINSVVISRTPAEDNIYMRNEESIETNGLTEFKIENNEIMDKDRESAITPIYEILNGINFYPFETTTEGLGWYEIADSFNVFNENGDVFNTSLFNFSINIDGSIKETLKTVADTKTQTQYQYATTINKRITNTEIIVNKQDNEIKSIIEQQYNDERKLNSLEMTLNSTELKIEEINSETNEQIESLKQTIDGLTNTVSETGGNNILYYSTEFWESLDEQALGIGEISNTDIQQNTVSQLGYMLNNGTAEQKQVVKNGMYTVSFLYKKNIELANAYISINGEKYDLDVQDLNEWEEKVFVIDVTSNAIDFEIVADTDNSFIIADLMINSGSEKQVWSQNANETLTETVKIGKGIQVDSSSSNTYTRIDADGNRTYNKSTNERVAEMTDKGVYAKELEVEGQAKINILLIQQIGEQVWLTGIGG